MTDEVELEEPVAGDEPQPDDAKIVATWAVKVVARGGDEEPTNAQIEAVVTVAIMVAFPSLTISARSERTDK